MTTAQSTDSFVGSTDMQADLLIAKDHSHLGWLRHTIEKGSPVIVAGAIACGCAYVGLSDPEHKQIMPICGFYAVTGYYCPGCGMTRAVHNLLRFNLVKAIQFNLLIVAAIPVLVYLYTMWVLYAYAGKRFPRFKVSRKWAVVICIGVLVFVVGRNFPFEFAEYFARDRIR